MTAQQTLRAALEKHNLYYDDWSAMTWVAILEAMQQHRAEALEEVEKWVDIYVYNEGGPSLIDFNDLKAKLAALKTSPGGSLRDSEG